VKFEELRQLSEGSLRTLVSHGSDAVDRLFAIWELATRFGATAIHDRAHAAGEPSAGVRRHMCIVLAGGELDLLVALSRHDPDAGVRATASGLVARLAGGGKIPWAVVLERLASDREAEVRREIVREIALDSASAKDDPRVVAAVRAALEDESRDVRLEAFGLLARQLDDAAFDYAVACLVSASEPEHYALITRWLDLEVDASFILDTLRDRSIHALTAAEKQLGLEPPPSSEDSPSVDSGSLVKRG